jgi:hypothetical protein
MSAATEGRPTEAVEDVTPSLCPLCGAKIEPPVDRRCDQCNAAPRTRMLGLALARAAPPNTSKLPVVHVAPERGIAPLMRCLFGDAWLPGDINTERYQKGWMDRPVMRCDLATPSFAPASLHGLIHSHVLEHIPAPLDRILPALNGAIAPGGFHAFIVPGPFPPTYQEDLEGRMPREERDEKFGHPEHVRLFAEIVGRYFIGWRKVAFAELIDESELRLAGIIGPKKVLQGFTGKTVHLYIKPFA